MLTKEEYEKTLIKMFDSVRTDDNYKGNKSCAGVKCVDCPLNVIDCCDAIDVFKTIEIVEKWGKEHPVMTMEDKFVEVFGRKPIDTWGDYFCPGKLNIRINECGKSGCDKCVNKFWKSEYVPPKKGE